MARYRAVYKDGQLLAEYEGDRLVYISPEYQNPKRSNLSAPMIVRDISAYRSPIDNTLITSRSAHREHLKVHDVIEVGNEHLPAPVEVKTRDIGESIKRHLDEVKALPQRVYDDKVRVTSNGD